MQTRTLSAARVPEARAERRPATGALRLVSELCTGLDAEAIEYCHWKSNTALDRTARGDNDLDLLIERSDALRYQTVLHRCGFKPAQAPAGRRCPGVMDHFGYDAESDKWAHVHTHFHLVLGHDATKNYRLAIERQYLASSTRSGLFNVPAVELEYVVFVIRMVLKHLTWDAVLGRERHLNASESREFAALQAEVARPALDHVLARSLPYIGSPVFDRCVRALQAGSARERIAAARALRRALDGDGRRQAALDTTVKLWRRATGAVRRRLFHERPAYTLAHGGATIALVGGDGAGKSTALAGLRSWLGKHFHVAAVHLGKPKWSMTTIAVRTVLKAGQLVGLYGAETSLRATLRETSVISSGYPYLLREVCRARDRYRTYVKARRIAARGRLVLFDRFPIPGIRLMDGPQTRLFLDALSEPCSCGGRLRPNRTSACARLLVTIEERYYRRMMPPDLLIALRVDPDTAVRRKEGEDPRAVRERCAEMWSYDWSASPACVVDAGMSAAAVLAHVKTMVWSRL